jgi:hypothetical protein
MAKAHDDDSAATSQDEATARTTVDNLTNPDPTDKMTMHVSDDGMVSFGDSDARGERTAKVGDDDEDEDVGHPGMSEADREALRAKRRLEKKNRREKARVEKDTLRSENSHLKSIVEQLSGQLGQMQQRVNNIDVNRIDKDLEEAATAYNYWNGVFEEAVKKADGAGARTAMEKAAEIRARGEQLFQLKQQANNSQVVRPAVDPSVQSRVDSWRARPENAWYNPLQPDEDTEIALLVDKQVARAGFKPNTDEFWAELDRRLKKRLPHRYEADVSGGGDPDEDSDGARSAAASGAPARRVASAGGGNAGSSGGAPKFQLSAQRIEAMKQAGSWNDSKKRESQIRAFMAYDKAERAKRGQ